MVCTRAWLAHLGDFGVGVYGGHEVRGLGQRHQRQLHVQVITLRQRGAGPRHPEPARRNASATRHGSYLPTFMGDTTKTGNITATISSPSLVLSALPALQSSSSRCNPTPRMRPTNLAHDTPGSYCAHAHQCACSSAPVCKAGPPAWELISKFSRGGKESWWR